MSKDACLLRKNLFSLLKFKFEFDIIKTERKISGIYKIDKVGYRCKRVGKKAWLRYCALLCLGAEGICGMHMNSGFRLRHHRR
jgi:hypothetical protein